MTSKYYPELKNPPKDGDLKVWWIPQVPMESFEVPVSSPIEAKKLLDAFAYYDLFQLEHNVKPDYSNAGGLIVFDGELGDWVDWIDDETGDDIDMFELVNSELIHTWE